ncbi:hypothetical protein [Tannockella kyphosi]|uniref:hypothetical protein n=1 Tax=Tannockella kyphosi TaxID=2899121 RepID=UPI002013942C|nr:hypothetical protein [Tannockella kyphosi]
MSRLKNNQGSTLMTVMVVLLVVSIFVVGLQTMFATYISSSNDDYYEKQVYLSSLSIASAISFQLEQDSLLLQEGSEELSEARLSLVIDVANLQEGQEIELGEVCFDDSNLQSGITTVCIYLEDEYVMVESTTKWQGYQETVKASLVWEVYEVEGVMYGLYNFHSYQE